MLSQSEIRSIISETAECNTLSSWDSDFTEDLRKQLVFADADELEFKLTPKQEEQLIRIRDQHLGGTMVAKKGHNNPPEETEDDTATVNGISGEQLKSYIERIENLEEERSGIGADIREVFAEAKANGFDTKAMRRALKLRKLDVNEREEQDYLDRIYQKALGMKWLED